MESFCDDRDLRGTELLGTLAVENYYSFDMEVQYIHENLFKTQEVKNAIYTIYTLHLLTNI